METTNAPTRVAVELAGNLVGVPVEMAATEIKAIQGPGYYVDDVRMVEKKTEDGETLETMFVDSQGNEVEEGTEGAICVPRMVEKQFKRPVGNPDVFYIFCGTYQFPCNAHPSNGGMTYEEVLSITKHYF